MVQLHGRTNLSIVKCAEMEQWYFNYKYQLIDCDAKKFSLSQFQFFFFKQTLSTTITCLIQQHVLEALSLPLGGWWWNFRLLTLWRFVMVMNDSTAAALWWKSNEQREPAFAAHWLKGKKVPVAPLICSVSQWTPSHRFLTSWAVNKISQCTKTPEGRQQQIL